MKKFKAVIFDMDGTIVDTEKLWINANKNYLAYKGIEYTKELEAKIAHKIHGLSTHKALEIIKEATGIEDDLAVMIRDQNMIIHELFDQGIDFIQGFQEFHDMLIKNKIKTAIATNADPMGLAKTDKALNLKRFFNEHMYCIECVNYICKPAPNIYLHAAQMLGVKPDECVAIEDSVHGVKAAVAAGMHCIAIDTSSIGQKLAEAHMIIDAYHKFPLEKLFSLENLL